MLSFSSQLGETLLSDNLVTALNVITYMATPLPCLYLLYPLADVLWHGVSKHIVLSEILSFYKNKKKIVYLFLSI